MRVPIKVKIAEILEQVISYWRQQASIGLTQGKPKEVVQQELNRNLQALMRLIIELSSEIN